MIAEVVRRALAEARPLVGRRPPRRRGRRGPGSGARRAARRRSAPRTWPTRVDGDDRHRDRARRRVRERPGHRRERGDRQHRRRDATRTGARHRIGGYGWQMGDEGSGYAIGRAALGAVSRAARRPEPAHRAHRAGCSRPLGAPTSTRWCAGRRARHPRRWPPSPRTCSRSPPRATRWRRGSPTTPRGSCRSWPSACCRIMEVDAAGRRRGDRRPARRRTGRSAGAVLARLGEEPGLSADGGPGGRGGGGAAAGAQVRSGLEMSP